MDLAFVRRRLRELREQLGFSQEQIADRAELSKNFVSAMERGAKGFSMESFLSYVNALGISPAEVLQTVTETNRGVEPLSEPERALIAQWRRFAEGDRRRLLECMNYLEDSNGRIRQLAQQQLDVLQQAVYGERLKTRDGLAPEANDPPAG